MIGAGLKRKYETTTGSPSNPPIQPVWKYMRRWPKSSAQGEQEPKSRSGPVVKVHIEEQTKGQPRECDCLSCLVRSRIGNGPDESDQVHHARSRREHPPTLIDPLAAAEIVVVGRPQRLSSHGERVEPRGIRGSTRGQSAESPLATPLRRKPGFFGENNTYQPSPAVTPPRTRHARLIPRGPRSRSFAAQMPGRTAKGM